GLPAALVVERADPYQPVRALLDGERAVGVRRLHRERGRLDAGLFRVRRVVDLGRIAVPLRPSEVHAHEHLGEVRRVHTARAGPDRHERLARVVLTGQQRPDLQLLDRLAKLADLRADLAERAGVALGLCEVQQDTGVVEPRAQPLDLADLGARVR